MYIMESHYENFLTTFYKFIFDLNRYCPCDNLAKVLEIFGELDAAKIIFKIYHVTKDNSEKITKRDETLFSDSFVLLPGIDLAIKWTTMIRGQKDKIWTYLNILYIESELVMGHVEKSEDKTQTETEIHELKDVQVDDFNPYEGVGTNDAECTVEQMYSYLDSFDDEVRSGPGIEMIAKMIGIHKMINVAEFTEKLRNMKKEDIDKATLDFRDMMGGKLDQHTEVFFNNMLTNISDKMKTTEMPEGSDPFVNLLKVGETVAEEMKGELKNCDIKQILTVCSQQMKDSNGNSVFPAGMNPFAMLGKMADSGRQGDLKEEDCAKECAKMMQDMGMGHLTAMIPMQRTNTTKNRDGKRKNKGRNRK